MEGAVPHTPICNLWRKYSIWKSEDVLFHYLKMCFCGEQERQHVFQIPIIPKHSHEAPGIPCSPYGAYKG